MKQFHLSHYPSREYMLESKAEYYQKVCEQLLEQLRYSETVMQDSSGEWYWTATGEIVGEDIE